LGLRPRPRWGSLQRSPDPLAGFNWPTIKQKEGRRREGKMEAKEMCKEEVEGEGVDIAWLDL